MDVKVDNIPSKAFYDLRCAGVAVSRSFFLKFELKPQQVVQSTRSSANGVTTINQDVFDPRNVYRKVSDVCLIAVVLPVERFNVLLGILDCEAGVSLNAEQRRLVHGANKYTFESMVIPELPKEVISVVIYAAKHCQVPAEGKAKLFLAPFKKGAHGG